MYRRDRPRYATTLISHRPRYANNMHGSGFADVVRKTAKTIGIDIPEPKFEGEKHIIGLSAKDKGKLYNWAGPGTNVEKRTEDTENYKPRDFSKPINKIDLQAYKHDVSYHKTNKQHKSGKLSKDEAKKEIWKADKEFKQGVEKNKNVDPILAKIAQSAISLKEVGERIGILPINKFSLSGSGKSENVNPNATEEAERLMEIFKPKPGMRLKQMVGKGTQKGGIAPIVISVVASLAGTALGKLFDYFVSKKKGDGMMGEGVISDEDKREHILNEMQKLPKKKQLKLLTEI